MTEVLKELTCKCCGAGLDPAEEKNGVIRCVYCGAAFIKEKPDCTPEIRNYLAIAETHLDTLEFDKALTTYKKVSELDPDEPKAWFGMALAKFKVQYLHDKVYNRLQPICHDITDKLFTKDKNHIKALYLATEEQKKVYEQKAQEIDEINKEFKELEKQGLDFDTFICVKVTDDNTKNKTEDHYKALDLYWHLLRKNFKPFYSEVDNKDRTGSKYEALILYALKRSKSMIIVCGNEEYLDTKWVKNEYTRYSEMIANEEKERNAITIAFFNGVIEKLPGMKGKYQGVDLNKPDAYSIIENHVKRFLTPKEKSVKYCSECGTECIKVAKFCLECGNKSFVDTKEEYEDIKQKRLEDKIRKQIEAEYQQKLQAEAKRKEEAAAKRQQEQAAAEMLRKKQEEWKQKEAAEQTKMEQLRLEPELLLQRELIAKEVSWQQLATNLADFKIKKGTLKKYKGAGCNVVIPNSVTSIGEGAFAGCTWLTGITIPNSVTNIGRIAFGGCSGLTSITIPNGVKSIGERAFYDCSGLTSITILKGVTSIEDSAFCDCYRLTSITIPNSVTTIGGSAFERCIGLTSITIPNSVTNIGDRAFEGCRSLTGVYYTGSKEDWAKISIADGNKYLTGATIHYNCSK